MVAKGTVREFEGHQQSLIVFPADPPSQISRISIVRLRKGRHDWIDLLLIHEDIIVSNRRLDVGIQEYRDMIAEALLRFQHAETDQKSVASEQHPFADCAIPRASTVNFLWFIRLNEHSMPRRTLLAGFSDERGKHFDGQLMQLWASVDRPVHRTAANPNFPGSAKEGCTNTCHRVRHT